MPAVAPKIRSPKSSIERQSSLDRQTSVESVDTTSPTVMSTSRRSSTDTILPSPKIVGSEDFSIDLSTDSLKVEIGERKRPESGSNVSERQILLEKMFENQSSIDQLSERSIESPRPASVASSAATVVESPKKKKFDQFPFDEIQTSHMKDISVEVKLKENNYLFFCMAL